jgi:hypothetical protein
MGKDILTILKDVSDHCANQTYDVGAEEMLEMIIERLEQ